MYVLCTPYLETLNNYSYNSSALAPQAAKPLAITLRVGNSNINYRTSKIRLTYSYIKCSALGIAVGPKFGVKSIYWGRVNYFSSNKHNVD